MTSRYGATAARAAAAAVRDRLGASPRVGIILGSGLGGLAGRIQHAAAVPYAEVPGFPSATVPGHAGTLFGGTLGGTPVVALAGRFHMYEGHEAALAGFPVRVLHALGARTLIVSNAAGGARATLAPGTLMLLSDHLNFQFRNPLTGPVEDGDIRFPDMSEPYDAGLRALAREIAAAQGIPLAEGVYAALLGPTYETRAEVRMLQTLGVDAIGMSTVPEVIVARALGMRVLGFSCVTNLACGLSSTPITHQEVLETTARVAAQFEALVQGVVQQL